jgi:hypothetical protein
MKISMDKRIIKFIIFSAEMNRKKKKEEIPMLKNKLMNVVLLAGIVSVILLSIAVNLHAWTVTVKNDTGETCRVNLYYTSFDGNKEYGYKLLPMGSTVTFETGAWCPSGFIGIIFKDPKNLEYPSLASTSILGHETGMAGFSAGCWNSSWTICRKRGAGSKEVSNNDYGFCKQ